MRILQCNRTKPVIFVGITRDDRTLLAGGEGGFEAFDLGAGRCLHTARHEARRVFTVVPDPLGRWVYFAGIPGGFWIYDLGPVWGRRRLTDEPGNADHHVVGVAASADGSRLAVARGIFGNHRLECWAVAADGNLSQVWSVPAAHGDLFRSLAFHPAGQFLAAIENSIVLRDAGNGSARLRLARTTWTRGYYHESAFSAKGDEFAVWDENGLHLFALGGGEPERAPRRLRHVGQAYFRGVAFHPSGRFVITVANDGVARYWDLATLEQMQAFAWKAGKLQSLALSADGTLAAAGTDKGKVVLWDVDA